VTNLETGESVEVQINDRGPYAKGRDIDLSKAAAKEIGIDKKNGEAPVKIEANVPKEAPLARRGAGGLTRPGGCSMLWASRRAAPALLATFSD
jgi:rare lipoprotein A (peptidoglycan hydrolase)